MGILDDIRRYRGHMPVRMEREDVLRWIGGLIGNGWLDRLWVGKWSGYHEVRYRFGDVQEAQWYLRDGTWEGVPLGMWERFWEMDREALNGECWEWIMGERSRLGVAVRKARSDGGLLDV